jgi:hypothetical protein
MIRSGKSLQPAQYSDNCVEILSHSSFSLPHQSYDYAKHVGYELGLRAWT